jgi:DNA repair protein RadC
MLDAELLAIVLGTGVGSRNALAIAVALLEHFRDLRRLAAAGFGELASIPGIGLAQACRVKAALHLAQRLVERPVSRGEPMSGPEEVARRVGRRLVILEREVLVCLAMDVKNRVLGEAAVGLGSPRNVEVVLRDAFTPAVREGAVSIIVLHNHPSGDPTPSPNDHAFTERFVEAGRMLGIEVLDHLVVAHDGWTSLASGRTASW